MIRLMSEKVPRFRVKLRPLRLDRMKKMIDIKIYYEISKTLDFISDHSSRTIIVADQ